MANTVISVLSPVTLQPIHEIRCLTLSEIDAAVERATHGFAAWKHVPIAERVAILQKFCQLFEAKQEEVTETIVSQMGRPRRYGAGEVKGVLERAQYMISVAEQSLADEWVEDSPQVKRLLRKEPLGPVFIIAAWNYPYLTMGNPYQQMLLHTHAHNNLWI